MNNKVNRTAYLHRVMVLIALFTIHCTLFTSHAVAQDVIVNPDISYAGTPRQLEIGGMIVKGVEGYEDYVLTGLSGLSGGQVIDVPGTEITEAVKRYWKHGLFSKVSISADSIVGNKVYLCINLGTRPRVSTINYYGLKKTEREDMEAKLGIMKGSQITPNMIDRAKILAKKYFDDKGYNNAEVEIAQRDDVTGKNEVILDITVDKKSKMKVREIIFDGNEKLSKNKLTGSIFKKGAFGKINEDGKIKNFFKAKKFTPERYEEAKTSLIEKYNELGYRDACILEDSVWTVDEKHVNVYVKLEEGERYYIRDITWVGNTVVTTDYLKGDVYNQKLMKKRLSEDEDAIGNYYWNNGYLFYQLEPTEVNIVGDSIDLEMRIQEGTQAHISHVRIFGNDRLYEEVVRRELRTKPGDLFSKDAIQRSAREISTTGFFDPEKVNPDIKPNYDDGSVDINWELEQKSNDQLEFSLGWGQTSFQSNGSYYSSVSTGYSTGWFGGKRPNALSISAFYSKQSDISSTYRNSAWMNNYYNYYGGYGSYNSGYYDYTSMMDEDKYIKLFGASIGWGKRLRWPDDYFQLSTQLSYTRYILRDWSYFLISNGNCNNINLGVTLSRSSTDNQLFPRRGSEFMLSVTLTPPWSLFNNKDYANLATAETYQKNVDQYNAELQEKYRWIEYHKWKFKTKTYTALTEGQKCLVLMTRVELGLLGAYNKYNKSPFETFYVGGDGMSGYSSSYAEETIGLRGYENGSLTPYRAEGYAYDRFTLELRYPILLGNTTIYGLGFLEGGNAWTETKNFNPFDIKRSAGLGVRIFLPMVGLMGIDWAYGFDRPYGTTTSQGGSQFHFILGQEF